jgi:hypothetical protein
MRHPLNLIELEAHTLSHIETAKKLLISEGAIDPIGIVLDNENVMNLIPFDFSTPDNKTLSLAKFQLIIVKKQAKAAWVIAETWLVVGSDFEKVAEYTPANHPDKIEAIIGIGSNEKDTVLTKFFFSRDANQNPVPSDMVSCDVMGMDSMPEFQFETSFFPKRWEVESQKDKDQLDKLWNYFF